jgi:hypothetical protein
LFCSVLFCSVLFCSVLFCSVLFCSVLFCSVLFCSVLFCSLPGLSILVIHCLSFFRSFGLFTWSSFSLFGPAFRSALRPSFLLPFVCASVLRVVLSAYRDVLVRTLICPSVLLCSCLSCYGLFCSVLGHCMVSSFRSLSLSTSAISPPLSLGVFLMID